MLSLWSPFCTERKKVARTGNFLVAVRARSNCSWDYAYANEFSVCVASLRISAANGNVSFDGVDVCRRAWVAIYVGSVGTVVLLVTSAFTGTKFTHLEAGGLPFLRIVSVQTQKTTVNWAIVGWFFWLGFSVTFWNAQQQKMLQILRGGGGGQGSALSFASLSMSLNEQRGSIKKLGHLALGN